MNKELEYKLMKRASDLADDSWLASPAIQSALLGGLGYFGADYLYDKLSDNKWQEDYINNIEDPVQRELVRKKMTEERENKKKWWRRGAGLVGAAIPMINNYSNLSEGWSKGKNLWGGNTVIDRTTGGLSGATTAALFGNQGVSNMNKLEQNSSDFSRKFLGNVDNSAVSNEASMEKKNSELSYIYDNLEKKAGAYNDAFSGMDFKMPYVRPMSTNAFNDIPVASSLKLINSPNNAAIMGPDINRGLNQSFQYASGGLGAGMISTDDLIKSITRIGIGYGVGDVLGSVLGTVFAQSPTVKEKLGTIGGIGGAIINSGIFR